MVCNESLDFLQVISHALQSPSMVLQLSTLSFRTRDSVSCRHRSMLYPTEHLSLMLVSPG